MNSLLENRTRGQAVPLPKGQHVNECPVCHSKTVSTMKLDMSEGCGCCHPSVQAQAQAFADMYSTLKEGKVELPPKYDSALNSFAAFVRHFPSPKQVSNMLTHLSAEDRQVLSGVQTRIKAARQGYHLTTQEQLNNFVPEGQHKKAQSRFSGNTNNLAELEQRVAAYDAEQMGRAVQGKTGIVGRKPVLPQAAAKWRRVK